MNMASLPKCPHCGYKEVSRVEGFYRCAGCLSDFGRVPYDDNGVPMIEACSGLRFRFGDLINGSVRLRMGQDGDVCLYEIYDSNGGGLNKHADMLDKAAWDKFRKELFNKVYVNDWNKEYIPVNDGTPVITDQDWELSVIVDENEEYIFRGYGAFPVYWDKFMKLLKPILANLEA
jgi:hypothetical protein